MSKINKQHIYSFLQKLEAVDLDWSPITGYPLQYLQLLLLHKEYYVRMYSDVLEKSLIHSNIPMDEIIFMDYGAGNGLLGLFAKHCGCKKVYVNDISPMFLQAAETLAAHLQLKIDGWIEGGWKDTEKYFIENEVPNVVAGTDVIEHIYNLEELFIGLKKVNPKMVCVFTTASNTANPFKNKQLKKLQWQDENEGSNAAHAMPGDEYAGLPFFETRKRIIAKHFPQIPEDTIIKLAKTTRGLNYSDIIMAIEKFSTTSEMPLPPAHTTNTCDPITGSWTERLLTITEYKSIYEKAGFSFSVYNGFYNSWQSGAKRLPLSLANNLIKLFGQNGKIIAPYITLVGN